MTAPEPPGSGALGGGSVAEAARTNGGAAPDTVTGPDAATASTAGLWRQRFRRVTARDQVPLKTILVTLGLVIAAYLLGKVLYRLRDIILVFALAGFIALVLDPLVVALQRWKVRRRGSAVALVTLAAVLVFIGLAFAFGYPLVNGLTHLAENLPTYVKHAEQGKGWIGKLIRKYHIERWVKQNVPKLEKVAASLGKPALALGKGAATVLLELFVTFILVILLLLEGPKMRAFVLGQVSPARAARWSRLGSEINRSVSGYILGDFLTSLIAGAVVLVTLLLLGVPYAFLWALWVALVDFLPEIGGALAGIPTVLFALAHSLVAGIVTAVVFLVYTQIENHVLNPIVMSKTVRVNPLLVLVFVLVGAEIGVWVGGALGGFVAAVVAIPVAGSAQIVARTLWRGANAELSAGGPGPPSPGGDGAGASAQR